MVEQDAVDGEHVVRLAVVDNLQRRQLQRACEQEWARRTARRDTYFVRADI